jgi:hypothetical protein
MNDENFQKIDSMYVGTKLSYDARVFKVSAVVKRLDSNTIRVILRDPDNNMISFTRRHFIRLRNEQIKKDRENMVINELF